MATEQHITTSYKFTEEELFDATIFNPLQLMYLKTMLASHKEYRYKLPVDPDNVNKFVMESEYERGAIDALENIINQHEENLELLALKAATT